MGIGIDLVEHSRISLKLAERILSDLEKLELDKLSEENKITYIAGRFAVKEAYFKATGDHRLKSISVLNDPTGKPYIYEDKTCEVSISHTKDLSIGIVYKHC
jgi:phosphopantetheine--protein transferase-like protein